MTAQPQQRARKRSGSLVLTGLMAGTAVSITACDNAPSPAQWGDPPAARSGQAAAVQAFANPQECKAAGTFTPAQCDAAYAEAQKASAGDAPRFSDQQSCEERYGVDQCVPRSSPGGGSFFTPLLTGFIIGQALNNLGGGFRGEPMYRDRGGNYYGGSGRPLSRDYLTGRPQVRGDSFDAPNRVQSRSAVISRGGFGGSGRSFGG